MKIHYSAALLALLIALPACAANSGCAPVLKAVNAGMAQPRIHSAIDAPLDAEAVKHGFKPTLMHSIVIDQLQYSNALKPTFAKTALDSPQDRQLATDLAAFQVEQGCKALGTAKLAGADTQAYQLTANLGRGGARVKLWVDAMTGLPLRAVTDEPDVDVDFDFNPATKKAAVQHKPNGKRVVATHAYLYGDAVKPPDAKGGLDPAAVARLQALLKGAP